MRIVLQQVSEASVSVEERVVGQIGPGYLLFVGVETGDSEEQADWLARKIARLRLFLGPDGKINDRTIIDVGGGALVVSQFTLHGSVEGGNRPDYSSSARPQQAAPLIAFFARRLAEEGVTIVEQGQFGAHMKIRLLNDGPVTLLLERRGEYDHVSNA